MILSALQMNQPITRVRINPLPRSTAKPILFGHEVHNHLPTTMEPTKSKNAVLRFFQRLGDWVKNFFGSAWQDIRHLFKMEPPHVHGDGSVCHDESHDHPHDHRHTGDHHHDIGKPIVKDVAATGKKKPGSRRTGFSMGHLTDSAGAASKTNAHEGHTHGPHCDHHH